MEKNFKKISHKIRYNFLHLLKQGYKYHIGGTASCIDLLVALFYGDFISLKKKNRSPFILSKGHALAAFYLILIDQKIISKNKFDQLNSKGLMGGQLDIFNLKKYVDWNSGSLGHSVGVCIGFAIANPKKKIWTVIGDAEMDEGSIWEALFFISENKINNIIIIIDRNKISASSKIENKEIFDKKILNQLNFKIQKINGHNFKAIIKSYDNAYKEKRSSIIIANTIKGKGFGVAENNVLYSHMQPKTELLQELIKVYE
jgi:transketolase